MNRRIVVSLLLASSILAHAADDSKTIRVDQTTFSDIYPAVWFSPSTGEIAPLKERSEAPPAEDYEIWIEPGDPEFGYNPETKPTGVGFALIGKGPAALDNPKIPDDPTLELRLTDLMRDVQASEHPVFYCKAATATCLIMVTLMDVEAQRFEFKWRPLSAEHQTSGEPFAPTPAPDPVSSLLDRFAEAVLARDVGKAESLFLSPDDTPDGKNRQRHIEEFKKDWSHATERDRFAAVKFRNTTVLVQTQMIVEAREGQVQVIPVEFKVSLGEDGYKIVSMEYRSE